VPTNATRDPRNESKVHASGLAERVDKVRAQTDHR
jgi:hypothetical protein